MSLDIKFGKYIEDAFKIWKENLGLMAGLGAVTLVLCALCFVLAPLLFPGLFAVSLALVDGRQPKPAVGDLFKGTAWFLQTLIFMLIVGVVVGLCYGILVVTVVGAPLAPLVGLAAGTATFFVVPLIVDRNMQAIPAIKQSWALAKSSFFPILGLVLVAGILGQIGAIACGIGVILTLPLQSLVMAAAYRDIMAQTAQTPVDVKATPAG